MDDDVIFVRANKTPKRRGAAKNSVPLPTKLASSSDVLAHSTFTGLALENTSESNQVGATGRYGSSEKPLMGQNEAFWHAAHTPAQPATAKEAVECQDQIPATERTSMRNQITKLEKALKRKKWSLKTETSTMRKQIALLKAQIERQEEAHRINIGAFREQNARLKEDKGTLEGSLGVQKDKISTLEAEIIELTDNLRKQKELSKPTKAKSKKVPESTDDAMTSIKQASESGKRPKKRKRHDGKLLEDISRKELKAEPQSPLPLGKAARGHEVDGINKDREIKQLQDQILKLKQGFRERGDQIIQLSRDSVPKTKTKPKPKMEKEVAPETKSLLRTHVTGMFVHYGSLLEKNTVLLGKLTAMAEAGGFGHKRSLYRQELDRLKGQPLDELNEYINRV